MKQTIRTIALFMALTVAASGCQKEMTTLQPEAVSITENTVHYSADNLMGNASLQTDADWDEFITRMFALAREGYEVTVYSGSTSSAMTKETVTYVTDDENDAKNWAIMMIKDGYNVTILFDEETGAWTCIAVKP